MRLIVEAANRPGACYSSFSQAQEAVIEALQMGKLIAYGLENGEGDLKEIPALLWADLKFWWEPDHAGPRDCFRFGASCWIALRFRRKDILAIWPDPLDKPDDKTPAEEAPTALAASCDTGAGAGTSKHTANVGEVPRAPSVHVGDNAFRSMDGLTWAEISITFVGTESVRVRARGRNETFTFDAMGFRHRISHIAKPNECWKTFLRLAIVSTLDKTWEDVSPTHDVKKRISRLREELKRFFGIANDPIAYKRVDTTRPLIS